MGICDGVGEVVWNVREMKGWKDRPMKGKWDSDGCDSDVLSPSPSRSSKAHTHSNIQQIFMNMCMCGGCLCVTWVCVHVCVCVKHISSVYLHTCVYLCNVKLIKASKLFWCWNGRRLNQRRAVHRLASWINWIHFCLHLCLCACVCVLVCIYVWEDVYLGMTINSTYIYCILQILSVCYESSPSNKQL